MAKSILAAFAIIAVFSLMPVSVSGAADDKHVHKLVEAAKAGDIGEVKALVEGGINIDETDSYGDTPLMWAAGEGNLDIVKYLAEKGADVNKKDIQGWTPLMSAAGSGSVEVVKFLLDKGADPNIKDKFGNTALDAAVMREHGAVADELKKVTKTE
ncbi:MAG: ankyrin repeat domain-containing protein [Deltaproteobacteria bacterium]|nr:ankyrin repeat domain-containing protein [Deltaproteobacteria bacterium]